MCSRLVRTLDGLKRQQVATTSKSLIVKLTCTGEVPLSIMPFIKPASEQAMCLKRQRRSSCQAGH